MNRSIFSLILLCLFGINAQSQCAADFTLLPSQLEGIKPTIIKTYGSDELWEYINGGADLYLEYGFTEVLAQELDWQGSTYRVDAYVMNSPLAAFGIFSILGSDCSQTLTNKSHSCISKYQVQLLVGNTYLSVVPLSNKEGDIDKAIEIANALSNRDNHSDFATPLMLEFKKISPTEVKYIKGQLGLQNGFPKLEKALSALTGYELWVVPITINNSSINILLCCFNSEKDKKTAIERLQSNHQVTFWGETSTKLLFSFEKESDIPSQTVKDLLTK
jgi:hypothetical protein